MKSLGRLAVMSTGRRWLPALLGLVCSSCAWMPPDDTPRAQVRPLSEAAGTLGRSAHDPMAHWPSQWWWKQFGSAELDRIIASALRDSPTLRAAADRMQQAQAMADLCTAELLPLATSGVFLSEQHYSANSIQAKLAGQSFAYAVLNPVQLQYHLDLWGRDRAALEEAIGQARAQTAELAQARLLLAAAVARAYAGFTVAAEQERIAEAWVHTLEQTLQVQQSRYSAGLESRIGINHADARLEEVRQRYRALVAEVRLLRDQLAVLAGHGPDWGHALTPSRLIAREWPGLPANVPLGLVAHRPDIVAARFRAAAAAKGIEVATKAFYPDINIRGFAGLQSVDLFDVLFAGSSQAFAIGPSLELPLFQGGRLEAQLHSRQAEYDTAVDHYNAAVVRAAGHVADTLARWQDVAERRQRQQRVVADLEANQRLAATLHTVGLQNRSGPLLNRSVLEEQQLRLKALEAEHFRAIVDFQEALGGGYEFKDPADG